MLVILEGVWLGGEVSEFVDVEGALSVRIKSIGSSICRSSAVVMAAISALWMVWHSRCDLISMCVVVPLLGSTMEASSVGLPLICDPFV